MPKLKCGSCIYRNGESNTRWITCDYASIVGHTRKAQPPSECTYYVSGGRKRGGIHDLQAMGKAKQKKMADARVAKKQQYQERHAMQMVELRKLTAQGLTVREISERMQVSRATVFNWRREEGLTKG